LDLDADSRLTQEEFISGISPVEPFSKVDIVNTVKSAIAKKLSKKMKGKLKKKGTSTRNEGSPVRSSTHNS